MFLVSELRHFLSDIDGTLVMKVCVPWKKAQLQQRCLPTFVKRDGKQTFRQLLTQFKTDCFWDLQSATKPPTSTYPAKPSFLNYQPPPVNHHSQPPTTSPPLNYHATTYFPSPHPHTSSPAIDFQQTSTFRGFHAKETFNTTFHAKLNNTQIYNRPHSANTEPPQFTPTTHRVKTTGIF